MALGKDLAFRIMSLEFWFRDLVRPPGKILSETGIVAGEKVLDFGCGPGSFAIAAAKIVGPEGKVYAVDIHPLAIKSVMRKVTRGHFTNIELLTPDLLSTLNHHSVDLVIMYDVLHELDAPEQVLRTLHRLLKPGGRLSLSDHHMKDEQVMDLLVGRLELYILDRRKRWTFTFLPS